MFFDKLIDDYTNTGALGKKERKKKEKRRKKKRSVSSPVPWKMQWPNS